MTRIGVSANVGVGAGVGGHAIQCVDEDRALAFATVEFGRHGEQPRAVIAPQLNAAVQFALAPQLAAALEVIKEGAAALVTIFDIFGHELAHQIGQGARHGGIVGPGVGGRLGEVTVEPIEPRAGAERQSAREPFVECDTERIIVAAIIERLVDAPGLLR